MGRPCSTYGQRSTYRVLVGKHEGNRQLERPMRRGVKGKAVPLQAWTGPEGSRKLSFPDFVTTALRRGDEILKWIFRKWDGGMGWIDLAQDRDRWRDLVDVVMNLRVP